MHVEGKLTQITSQSENATKQSVESSVKPGSGETTADAGVTQVGGSDGTNATADAPKSKAQLRAERRAIQVCGMFCL